MFMGPNPNSCSLNPDHRRLPGGTSILRLSLNGNLVICISQPNGSTSNPPTATSVLVAYDILAHSRDAT